MPLNVEDITPRLPKRAPSRGAQRGSLIPLPVLPVLPVLPTDEADAVCRIDGMPLFATVVGPRCPVCGVIGTGRAAPRASASGASA